MLNLSSSKGAFYIVSLVKCKMLDNKAYDLATQFNATNMKTLIGIFLRVIVFKKQLVNPNLQSCWCVMLSMNECSFGRITYKTRV